MIDQDKIKIILQMLVAEIDKHLPEINKAVKDWNGKTDSTFDRDDLAALQRACNSIVSIEKFFGLTEAQRIIKGSLEGKKLTLDAKRSLGFDGCFE
jgi:hypothetical protein